MLNSHLKPTSTSLIDIRDWLNIIVGAVTTYAPVACRPKPTNTIDSVVEMGLRTRLRWGCLVRRSGWRRTPSVGDIISEGLTMRRRAIACRCSALARRAPALVYAATVHPVHLTAMTAFDPVRKLEMIGADASCGWDFLVNMRLTSWALPVGRG